MNLEHVVGDSIIAGVDSVYHFGGDSVLRNSTLPVPGTCSDVDNGSWAGSCHEVLNVVGGSLGDSERVTVLDGQWGIIL